MTQPDPEKTNTTAVKRKIASWRRRLAVVLGVCLLLGAAVLLIDAHVASIGEKRIVADMQDLMGNADCVIVPGALVYGNAPSPMLQDRLDRAIDVWRSGRAPRFLVSGDHLKKDYDEVNAMRHYLIAQGVPDELIFTDHAGVDTYDTLLRARDIFQVQRAILVTQRFHLLRGLYIGDRLGLDVQGVTSDQRIYPGRSWYRLRELLARCKAFLNSEILNSKPRFLGEVIPIDGDASQSRG